MIIRWLIIACNLLVLGCAAPAHRTENVVLITTDGLRWQEMFCGADESLLNKESGGIADVEATRNKFWRQTPEARRAALMPFMWSVVATKGQIFGNVNKGSVGTVTNGKNFSYPGYNELLCGFADPEINSNDFIANKNVTVLEWLHNKPQFRGRVAAFSGWDAMPFIINSQRAGFSVLGGWAKLRQQPSPQQELLTDATAATTQTSPDETNDEIVFRFAHEYLAKHKPRVLYVAVGETDALAHKGRYDLVLEAANNVDSYIHKLWNTMQSIPEYRGRTTFIISTDHGRGSGLTQWRDHNAKIAGAENIWIAVMGPDTRPLGERSNCAPVTQNQIAATLAGFLGEDYVAAVPSAGAPLSDVLPSYD